MKRQIIRNSEVPTAKRSAENDLCIKPNKVRSLLDREGNCSVLKQILILGIFVTGSQNICAQSSCKKGKCVQTSLTLLKF